MKILVIRFSSFGDVTQSLSVIGALAARFPGAEIHWVTREDFVPLIAGHPGLRRAWALRRRDGLPGLWRLGRELRAQTLIADDAKTHLIRAEAGYTEASQRLGGARRDADARRASRSRSRDQGAAREQQQQQQQQQRAAQRRARQRSRFRVPLRVVARRSRCRASRWTRQQRRCCPPSRWDYREVWTRQSYSGQLG